MLKTLLFLAIGMLLIGNLSALIISEVELNPPGTNDVGNEWIEFYSPEPVNLGEYTIYNNDYAKNHSSKDVINLTGTVNGYYILKLSKQWLDDSNEMVFLYKGTELVDETSLLADSANNDKTWQFCGNWTFSESTKEAKNCEIKIVEQPKANTTTTNKSTNQTNTTKTTSQIANDKVSNQENQSNEDSTNSNSESIEELSYNVSENTNESNLSNAIILGSQSLKTEKTSDKKVLAIFGLVTLCLLVALLFLLKGRKYKNEFG